MQLEAPRNANYAATIFRVPATLKLDGLDNLVAVPVFGYQALTQKDRQVGDLVVAFTAETQLSEEFASANNLYRDTSLNVDPEEVGYLEPKARIKAIKLRGHRSDALLMPLESLEYTEIDITDLQEGDTFDTLNGIEICRKYVLPVKGAALTPGKTKLEKAFSRVDEKIFPLHIDTDQYGKNKHLLTAGREVVITQKLHGTSIRVGNVPVLRTKGFWERLANKVGIQTPTHEFDMVYGSRKVTKDANNPNQNHYYGEDIWTLHGKNLDGLIPEGFLVYGELIGWTPDGSPIQKNYTYDVPKGEAHLYVYRVARVDVNGNLTDLSWDAVREFAAARGLKVVPELWRSQPDEVDSDVEMLLNERFAELVDAVGGEDPMVPLSHSKTVDEGVVIRQEGIVPVVLKAKAGRFLEHETKLLDAEEVDLESAA